METLKVSNITKRYGRSTVLSDVSLCVSGGEIVGLIGPNGAGKTTILKVIADLVRPNGGEVKICGFNLRREREKALSKLSAVIENPGLYDYLSGREHLRFVAKLRRAGTDKVNEIIDFIGIGGKIDSSVKKYSLGMKQRLAIGICLMTNPELLLLDEPTNGLDPGGMTELRRILTDSRERYGTSILISSHNLAEIEKICGRFIFINGGRVISEKNNGINSNIKTYRLKFCGGADPESAVKGLDMMKEYAVKDGMLYFSTDGKGLALILQAFAQKGFKYSDFEPIESNIGQKYDELYNRRD